MANKEPKNKWKNIVCSYCTAPFGSIVYWKCKERYLVRERDHFIPHAALGSPYANRTGGFEGNTVWSCQICNKVKANLVFDNFLEAKNYILDTLLASDWELRFNPLA